MLHLRFALAVIIVCGLSGAAAAATFPDVPPASPTIQQSMPEVPPPSPTIVPPFPDVPPPSPSLTTTAPPSTTGGMLGAPTPAPGGAVVVAPDGAQRAEQARAKKELQAAQEREAKAQRDFAAAKKSGKAPASAYATPMVVDVPKNFTGKEAELQELLILYRAGQISPQEYHRKRAEIVARP